MHVFRQKKTNAMAEHFVSDDLDAILSFLESDRFEGVLQDGYLESEIDVSFSLYTFCANFVNSEIHKVSALA